MSKEKSEEDKKVETLEDLDIGSNTIKKLREVGLNTIESLGMATIKEVEQVGINKKTAKALINKARLKMPFQFIRGDELVKMRGVEKARCVTSCA
ncbi:MAG: helix-hairpin-helix domain-containing protein [Candidatus Bathyarchaeota archaeon]